jgi:hypothetical protein
LGFVSDDIPIIADNPRLQSLSNFKQLISNGYWDRGLPTTRRTNGEYRPLTTASYLVNGALTGFRPGAFHLVNVLIHVATSLWVFFIARRLGLVVVQAGMAALLFSVMPIHAEAVTNTVGRADLLACFFSCAAWWLMMPPTVPARILCGSFALLLALLAKENAISIFGIVALSDYLQNRGPWNRIVTQRWPVWMAIVATAAIYLGLRRAALGQFTYPAETTYFSDASFVDRLLTMGRFIGVHYLWPMATGLGLCADFTRPALPDSTWTDASAWAALLSMAIALGASCYYFFRDRCFPAFCVLLFFVLLFPVSNLLIKIQVIGAERLAYFPSLAFCLFMGWAAGRMLTVYPARGRWIMGGFFLAVLLGALQTLKRNQVWASEETLWAATFPTVPNSPRALNGMGYLYMGQGRFDAAREMFYRELEIAPPHKETLDNIGRCFVAEERWAEAKAWIDRSLAIDPDDRLTLWLEGRVAEGQGRWKDAEHAYQHALIIDPQFNLAQRGLRHLQMTRSDLKRPS